MVYENTVDVPELVWKNLKEFTQNKKPTEDLFDTVTPTSLNNHFKTLMPGLSAKVFRTYNASHCLQETLYDEKEQCSTDDPEGHKLLFYNKANTAVAILCNHQRTLPKGYEAQYEKMEERYETMKEQIAELEDHLKVLTGKKKPPKKPKKDTKLPTSVEACKSKIERLRTSAESQKTKMAVKDETKTVALGTSKINYMDPRITVAWCKAIDCPLEKIFNTSLLQKFPWAVEVEAKWRF